MCIDGPAASGKTTLAADLKRRTQCQVVHMDDLYDGWDGLPSVHEQLATLLLPLVAGRPGTYRHYDWHQGRHTHEVTVSPQPLLVVEGVASASAAFAHLATVVAWVEAEHDVRRARGASRTPPFVEHWDAWAAAERAHFDADGTRARADLVVDTSTPG